MRICYIADQTSIHTQRWLRYFAKAGHEIFLIPHSGYHIEIDGINMLDSLSKLSYKSINFFSTLKKAKSLITELSPDILHAHFVEQFGWLAALLEYHPFVLTAWGTDIYSLPYASSFGIGKKFTQFTLKKADMMTAISKDLKTEMVRLGAKQNKINIIHWGVDLDKFNPNIGISELKQKLNINNRPVILSNRIFEKNSNIDVIVNSLPLVLQKISDAILLLQNPGGKLQEDIEMLIRDLGISESVRILPKYIYSDMPALYAISDVYVSVPSYDAACISLTEAMACGSIPIISEVPGPMEWVKNGYNGKVVPAKNPEALANAICNLMQNVEKRKLFRNRNFDLIQKKGNQKYWMNKMNELYKKLHKMHNSY
jgi:glycosyltransferase involved in cell wall biosynthesis